MATTKIKQASDGSLYFELPPSVIGKLSHTQFLALCFEKGIITLCGVSDKVDPHVREHPCFTELIVVDDSTDFVTW